MRASQSFGYGLTMHLIAPDEARDLGRRPVWQLLVEGAKDEEMETQGVLYSTVLNAKGLAYLIFKSLRDRFTSLPVYDQRKQIEEFVERVHAQYETSKI